MDSRTSEDCISGLISNAFKVARKKSCLCARFSLTRVYHRWSNAVGPGILYPEAWMLKIEAVLARITLLTLKSESSNQLLLIFEGLREAQQMPGIEDGCVFIVQDTMQSVRSVA